MSLQGNLASIVENEDGLIRALEALVARNDATYPD